MKTRIKPLYRKKNTTAHGVHHRFGGDYSDTRNSKKSSADHKAKESMGKRERRGLDYTPLFRFLLSKLGEDWDAVHPEALARLDREDPIYWMVARNEIEEQDFFVEGESAYFSGLYIDEHHRLQKVAPEMNETTLMPTCKCCTHTFNGRPFTQRFRP